MAEASKVSGEKYRRIFSEYDPVFVDAVSSAALSCNLKFFLSLIYSLCDNLVCDNLRNVNSKKERSMLLLHLSEW